MVAVIAGLAAIRTPQPGWRQAAAAAAAAAVTQEDLCTQEGIGLSNAPAAAAAVACLAGLLLLAAVGCRLDCSCLVLVAAVLSTSCSTVC